MSGRPNYLLNNDYLKSWFILFYSVNPVLSLLASNLHFILDIWLKRLLLLKIMKILLKICSPPLYCTVGFKIEYIVLRLAESESGIIPYFQHLRYIPSSIK